MRIRSERTSLEFLSSLNSFLYGKLVAVLRHLSASVLNIYNEKLSCGMTELLFFICSCLIMVSGATKPGTWLSFQFLTTFFFFGYLKFVCRDAGYNPGQIIWHRAKKSSKTEQAFKNVISNFACFLTAIVNV